MHTVRITFSLSSPTSDRKYKHLTCGSHNASWDTHGLVWPCLSRASSLALSGPELNREMTGQVDLESRLGQPSGPVRERNAGLPFWALASRRRSSLEKSALGVQLEKLLLRQEMRQGQA